MPTDSTRSTDPQSNPRRRLSDMSEGELSPYAIGGLAVVIIAALLGVNGFVAWFLGIAGTYAFAAWGTRR